jgi:S1-C subfamily serine protease
LVVFLLAVVLAILDNIDKPQPPVRRPIPQRTIEPAPPPPPITIGEGLDPQSPSDPILEVEIDERRDVIGSAFPVHKTGYWMTARHVVDGCDQVGIVTGRQRARLASAVTIHASADIALFSIPSQTNRPWPVKMRMLHRGQKGFGFGYPGGEWAQVHTLLLGRARQRTVGRYRFVEPVLVWSVRNTYPPGIKSLGGISGGPMLDTSGAVIGVHSSSSHRRGRLMTVAPITLTNMLGQIGLARTGAAKPPLDVSDLTEKRYMRFGSELRTRKTVVKVICDVN